MMAGDPYFPYVSLLLHFDGQNGSTSFTDSSGSPKSISAVGNARISTAQSAFGGASAYFDGSGDGLSIPFSSDLSLQGVDFVVEGLARYNGSSGYQTLIDFRGSAAYTASWGAFLDIANRSFGIYDGTVNSTVLYTATNSIPPPGNWFSWCVEKVGTTTLIYIGGAVAASGSTWVPPATHSSGVRIGINQADSDAFNGYMDELRITKGVARYADNYTPSSVAFADSASVEVESFISVPGILGVSQAVAYLPVSSLSQSGHILGSVVSLAQVVTAGKSVAETPLGAIVVK